MDVNNSGTKLPYLLNFFFFLSVLYLHFYLIYNNSFNNKTMADLTTKYLGLTLRNPLIAGSSGWTDNLQSLKQLEANGCGAVVLKSLFEEEIVRELKANMTRMTNDSFLYPETVDFYEQNEFPKQSTDEYLTLIENAKKELSIPVIASINCMTPGQWTYFPKKIEAAGADALELNLFILPADFNRSSAENEKVYFDIISAVKKQVKIPVSVKLSSYFSSFAKMMMDLSEAGANGIVLFNRFYAPDIDIEKIEVTHGSILSHSSEMRLTLRWIAIMANRVKCDLAASSGVHDGHSFVKMMLAGATTVQIASALYKNGPVCIHEMLGELTTWMDRKGFKSIDECRGLLSQAHADNPAVYERVQFMKYFRGYKYIE